MDKICMNFIDPAYNATMATDGASSLHMSNIA
jgi:hypothetical protein